MAPRQEVSDVKRQAKPNIRKIAQGKQPRSVEKNQPRRPVRRSARLDQKSLSWGGNAQQNHPYSSPSGDTLRKKQNPSSSLQTKGLKRKRLQETEVSFCIPANQFQKRPRISTAGHTLDQKAARGVYENNINPIHWWTQSGFWPNEYFHEGYNMSHLLPRKKSTSSLRRKQSESSSVATSTTPSDQKSREEKNAQYKNPRYEVLLQTKGIFMRKSELGITNGSKDLCQRLLELEQTIPKDSLFEAGVFDKLCEMIQNRNEAKVIQDVSRLIVPSAQTLAIYGARHLKVLVESVNEGWDNSVPITKPRPQPDYSVGFGREAFTDEQLRRLQPFVGNLTDTSYFMATFYLYFPFLTCEVKCGAAALDIADRQNSHSTAIAVRAIIELFKLVKCEQEVNREILAFSISHDHTAVRIYGHYAILEEEKINIYRHPIHKFDFTALDGKEKWTAYKFTRNIYDIWMPTHLKKICSAIDQIPPDVDFDISQSELQYSQQSNAESALALDNEDSEPSQLGYIDSAGVTPTTSFAEQTQVFKKPRKKQ
ncbi:conserved hypothetical protein [Histoplasma capsulatum G186AR]|uniref:DUF7924 domain-containing protein n=2 Tax=Ajellomyces capsulatus TaxID=5037 RepID=C0NEZ1_AJECG|nr:uncharacterized protein HCBG_01457 [Histoplasma capsulatum G186AR]EEH09812.1 conserved hypothetical protein [Histoplasma capsulatum G186AR]KAG5298833.1 hypothetical protein I7I52_08932 [Histoplasma capsulatum]QSS73174.1 hypothetical protein I7I50_01241 [Histoplasma capsulatum G186AR]